MAFDIASQLDKCIKVRAPLKKFMRFFNDDLQTIYANISSCFSTNDKQRPAFSSFDTVRQYSANTAYISLGWSAASLQSDIGYCWSAMPRQGSLGYYYNGDQPSYLYHGASTNSTDQLDANTQLSNVAGYLQIITVRDFCNKYGYEMARLYIPGGIFNRFNQEHHYYRVHSDGTIISELDRYGDYVLPYIQWYYTDTAGNRQAYNNFDRYNDGPLIGVCTVLQPTGKVNVAKIKYIDQYPVPIKQPSNIQYPPAYLVFFLPYYAAEKINDNIRGTRYVANTIGSGSIFRTGSSVDNPYGTLDWHDYKDDTIISFVLRTSDEKAQIYDELNEGSSQYYGRDGGPYHASAYKSVQDVIDIFADFGVFISTNLSDVYSYTGQGDKYVINPEPTDSLDSLPDNSSDITEITSAYITPASFGNQLIYNPISAKQFLHWVGDSGVDITNWSRLFANPIDAINSIKMYNLDLVRHDADHLTYNADTNILGVVSPGLANYSIGDGYNTIIDGGTLYLDAYYGNYADFTSMTYQCYLPFVGYINMRACDCVNKNLHLYYAVDFASGNAIAFLLSDNKLVYTTNCSVAGTMQLVASDRYAQEINNISAVLTGATGMLMGAATKNIGMTIDSAKGIIGDLQLQTHYTARGNISSINAYELLPAFLERTRYDLFLPSGEQTYLGSAYQSTMGAPSTQYNTVAACANSDGYIIADYVYIDNCPANAGEIAEIKRLLSEGVYI